MSIVKTTYDNTNHWEWDLLKEPPRKDLERLDRAAEVIDEMHREDMYASDLEILARKAKTEYDVLIAAYRLRNRYGRNKRADDGGCPEPDALRAVHKKSDDKIPEEEFLGIVRQAVSKVLPPSPYQNPHKIVSMVMSLIGLETAAKKRARKETERRRAGLKRVRKTYTYAELKAKREKERQEAAVILARGFPGQAEAYVPGIRRKRAYVPVVSKRKGRIRHKKRKEIPADEQLGWIVVEADREQFRMEHGYYPD
ncbi:MAG: hypothetical protein JWO00_506 [Candidatus Parcubacteria bacterium]|nr:hypothetical protein [Candidatus Parcubacteria bacterium]